MNAPAVTARSTKTTVVEGGGLSVTIERHECANGTGWTIRGKGDPTKLSILDGVVRVCLGGDLRIVEEGGWTIVGTGWTEAHDRVVEVAVELSR